MTLILRLAIFAIDKQFRLTSQICRPICSRQFALAMDWRLENLNDRLAGILFVQNRVHDKNPRFHSHPTMASHVFGHYASDHDK